MGQYTEYSPICIQRAHAVIYTYFTNAHVCASAYRNIVEKVTGTENCRRGVVYRKFIFFLAPWMFLTRAHFVYFYINCGNFLRTCIMYLVTSMFYSLHLTPNTQTHTEKLASPGAGPVWPLPQQTISLCHIWPLLPAPPEVTLVAPKFPFL